MTGCTAGRAAVLGILLGTTSPSGLGAAELVPSLDLASRYTWRGFARSSGWVAQPDLQLRNIAGQGIFLRAWGSFAIEDRTAQPIADEGDLSAGIKRKIGTFDATAAVTLYLFSPADGRRRTEEVWGALQGNLRIGDLDLRPQILAARDLGFHDATYVRLGAFPSLDFKEKMRLYPRLWVGFGDFSASAGSRRFGFQDASIEADLQVRPWQYKEVAFNLGPRLTRETTPAHQWRFWFSAGVTYRKAFQ